MIPIIYETNEVAFTSNGLGRLRDCISCFVTEERNGIYECDFEYPIDGANYELLQIGRIIGVTHDDTEDVQPFDIVGYTKPINGVVTFHCTHISYRQSYMTVTGSNINSLSAAFALLKTATPSNPFIYQTDKTSTGYFGAANGIPNSVRAMLGGVEGSILDSYGGEYEWDRWTVILHSARGVVRDFSIRYGLNMLDYNEEYDSQSTYSSCIPYWTDGTSTVVGDRQDSGNNTITGRGECVPLDVSERFENKPTKAQVNSEGLAYMNANNTHSPTQNIHVEFVRLQDMGFEGVGDLLQCKLCDSINVIFPGYTGSSQFKIVKTVWDVLKDKYDSMELGDLSTTLAEALGIENGDNNTGSTEPKYLSGIVNSTYSTTTANAWSYTGLSFTVPTGHVYVARINTSYTNGKPIGIGVHTSTSLTTAITAPIHNIENSLGIQNVTCLLTASTYYVWSKRAGTGSNTYRVDALDFDIS